VELDALAELEGVDEAVLLIVTPSASIGIGLLLLSRL